MMWVAPTGYFIRGEGEDDIFAEAFIKALAAALSQIVRSRLHDFDK